SSVNDESNASLIFLLLLFTFLLLPFKDDLRDSVLGGVREREVSVRSAERVEEFARVAAEPEQGSARAGQSDFDMMP
ncbi:MAG: hypothetical protein QOE46_3279, partial [Acidobacteriota bacterium]|nr:hypothetical protein [Acidobacteriota bacterium]